MSSQSFLIEKIQQSVLQTPGQVLPFAQFMEMALYDPEDGYYSTTHRQLGPQGDFVTSPHLCADFGELIAIQLKELWQVLGQPPQFTVVEMGAGQGLISVDVLEYFLTQDSTDPFITALEWKIIETSAALVRWQRHYLAKRIQPLLESLQVQIDIEWTTLEQLREASITGCFFSNELVDAFPIHWLEIKDSAFTEIGVRVANDSQSLFQTSLMNLSEEVQQYLAEFGIEAELYPEGYRCEVNTQARKWMADVASALKKGFVLTIDYGYSQQQLYSPARMDGTLQCYTQQKSHSDPLINVGNQDITSHVNFTALESFGAGAGLEKLGLTHQGLFLMSLGLGDRLSANNAQTDMSMVNEALQRREALHALMNPMGLGGFQVLLQGKALDQDQRNYPYRGFKDSLPGSLF